MLREKGRGARRDASEYTTDKASLTRTFDHVSPIIGADSTPYEYYEAVRDEVARTGQYVVWSETHGGFWAVYGYDEVIEVARRPDLFSNRESTFPPYKLDEPFMIAQQDDPDHKLARALVTRPFNPNGVRNYSETIRENVHALIDGFIESGQADLAQVISKPVPAIVTALILGMPAELGPKFSIWASAASEGHLTDPEGSARKLEEMYAYFAEVLDQHRANPGSDVLSHVVHAEVAGKRLNQQELLGFSTLLMIGGIDNTNRLLSTMLWRVGWDKELRRRLVRNPALVPQAVEEFLRLYSPACNARLIAQDVAFHGARMKKGQYLMNVTPIANRDPRTFDYPDAFLLERKPNHHIGLGIGIHRCLGAHLILLEARIVLEEFLKRIPEYEIDESGETRWLPGFIAGMGAVPVKFPPGKPLGNGARSAGVDTWLANACGAVSARP